MTEPVKVSVADGLRLSLMAARHEDPRVEQVQVLRALVRHAVADAPDLLASGLLEPAIAMLTEKVGEALHDGKGRPRDMAEWELRSFCKGAADALAQMDGKRGAKGRASQKVRDMVNISEVVVSAHWMKNFAFHLLPRWAEDDSLGMGRLPEHWCGWFVEADNSGQAVEDLMREGIALRVVRWQRAKLKRAK